MSHEVAVIRDIQELAPLIPEWREFLATRARGHNFFNDPERIQLSLKGPSVSACIVTVRREGKLRCIAPFAIHQTRFTLRWSVFRLASLPTRMATILGDSFVRDKDENPQELFALVFDALKQHRGEFDLVFGEALEVLGDLWNFCESAGSVKSGYKFVPISSRHEKSFQLALGDSHEEYLASLGASTRKNLRRRTKRIMEDASAKTTLVKITDPSEVAGFLGHVDEIWNDTWQAKTYGTHRRDSEAQVRHFESVAKRGWLRSYALLCDGRPIAFQIGYQYNEVYYACDFGYAQRCAELGPGAVLMYLMFEDLFRENKPAHVDLGYGDSPQKRTFRGLPRDVAAAYLIRSSRWQCLVSLQRMLNFTETQVRSALTALRVDAAVRRVLKHKR